MKAAMFILSVVAVLCAAPTRADDAKAVADRLLDAIGGADVWATRRYVHTFAINHHPQARLPYTQEAWIDLDQPRHRIELCNYDMQRVRAYTADGGWGLSEGRLYDFDNDRMVDELRGWRTRIYRRVRLLAQQSDALTLETDGHYLHLTYDGEYLGWIEVAPETGAPVSIGGERDDMTGTRFGSVEAFGDVNWVSSGEETGGWRFETMSFELLDANAEIAFAPSPTDAGVCPRVRSDRPGPTD